MSYSFPVIDRCRCTVTISVNKLLLRRRCEANPLVNRETMLGKPLASAKPPAPFTRFIQSSWLDLFQPSTNHGTEVPGFRGYQAQGSARPGMTDAHEPHHPYGPEHQHGHVPICRRRSQI